MLGRLVMGSATIFETEDAALEFVRATTFDGSPLVLAIRTPLTFDGKPDVAGLGMALLLDAILAQNYEPDGFEHRDGFRLYRYKSTSRAAPRHLTVTDEHGVIVAEVETDSPFDHAADGSLLAHIVGDFVAGPGFARVRSMLDRFHDAYERGDVQAASHLHDAIDRIGMRATDLNGIQHDVSVVYFQQGALLFTVSRKAPL